MVTDDFDDLRGQLLRGAEFNENIGIFFTAALYVMMEKLDQQG